MTDAPDLLGALPLSSRLALAYAPASSRTALLGLLALDARLAGIVRSSTEPMLAQLRLAWWRELLKKEPVEWPEGEPLLAALRLWPAGRAPLAGLVDGWEEMTGPAPLPPTALAAQAQGRAEAFAVLADFFGGAGERDTALHLARRWALADLAGKLSHPEERDTARALAGQGGRSARLSRPLRPLGILHALGERALRRGESLERVSPGALAVAMRVGLLGR